MLWLSTTVDGTLGNLFKSFVKWGALNRPCLGLLLVRLCLGWRHRLPFMTKHPSTPDGGASGLPASARKASPRLLGSAEWQKAMRATQAKAWPLALTSIRACAKAHPRDPWLALNMARTLVELDECSSAVTWAQITLDACPDDVLAQELMWHCLIKLQNYDAALDFVAHQEADVEQAVEKLNTLAYKQLLAGRADQSMAISMKALSLKMDHGPSHFLLGVSFMDRNEMHEALECFQTANLMGADRYQLASDAHTVYLARQLLKWDIAEPGLVTLTERVRGMSDDDRMWSAVFASATLLSEPALQLKVARVSADLMAAQLPRLHPSDRPKVPRPAGAPLKVGFLSCDFHQHATAFLIMELFEHLQSQGVALYLYSHGRDDGSAERRRLQATAARFIDLQNVSDAEAAQRIADDQLDVLVDLKGFTHGSRLQIMAYRPAPLQVSYLGHPGTTGASFIDYFIGDEVVTPLDHQPFYAEKLALMPHCYQPNDRQRPLPKPMSRSEVGLPPDALVLCGFNQPYKISPEVFNVWCDLLQSVPHAVLWLLDWVAGTVDQFKVEAARRGIAPERIISAPRLPLDRHLSRFALADIFLDSWPCNGHTTVSDALWAGVPVVTLCGETFASRVAASLLHATGLPELVSHDVASYRDLVLSLAADPERRQALRERLSQARGHCPLFDSARYALDFQALLTRMVDRQEAGLPVAPLPIGA